MKNEFICFSGGMRDGNFIVIESSFSSKRAYGITSEKKLNIILC